MPHAESFQYSHSHVPSPSRIISLRTPIPPLSLSLLLQSLTPQIHPPLPQPLQLAMNLLLVKRDPIRLLRLWPEIWDRKTLVEVGTVVVHYSNWEHDVHAKLVVELLT
ncbi:hypothetical protein ONS96_006276 [Cadophora gregata f. sp. sojae]|nr:hypothetical protein ONS96_006276 [Cadophora gregata f. sp. sojae]